MHEVRAYRDHIIRVILILLVSLARRPGRAILRFAVLDQRYNYIQFTHFENNFKYVGGVQSLLTLIFDTNVRPPSGMIRRWTPYNILVYD